MAMAGMPGADVPTRGKPMAGMRRAAVPIAGLVVPAKVSFGKGRGGKPGAAASQGSRCRRRN